MEKRISFFEFQSVKAVAKAIEPYAAKKELLIPRIEKLTEELQKKQEALNTARAEYERAIAAITAYEAGIVNIIGFHANELIKKVVETTEKDGKVIKTTKYVPTSIVTYDDASKQYVINTDAPASQAETPKVETPIVPPTTEEGSGSDFDDDNELPFSDPSETDPLF